MNIKLNYDPIRLLVYLAVIVALIDAITLIYGVVEAPFPSYVDRGSATAYRNMYVHIQMGWATYLFFTIALVSAILYLLRRDSRMERVAHTAITVGWLYGAATWITGTLWSVESWGAWWSWDPRQTSILFLLIAYAVYYVIRSSIRDPDVAVRISMVYAIAAYASIPLSFILPQIVEALHPTPRETFRAGTFSVSYMLLRAVIVLLLGLILTRLLYLRVARNAEIPRIISVVPVLVLIASLITSIPVIVGFTTGVMPDAREGDSVRFFGVVVDAELLDIDEVREIYDVNLKVMSGDREVEVRYRGGFILEPAVVEVKRDGVASNVVTLIGHYVVVEGVVTDDGVDASTIEIVNAWCVAASSVIYALTLLAIVLLIQRGV